VIGLTLAGITPADPGAAIALGHRTGPIGRLVRS